MTTLSTFARRAVAGVGFVSVFLSGQVAAASSPGWSVAKADAYLVFKVRVPDLALIAAAKAGLAQQKMLGGVHGIPLAEANLKDAEEGMTIDTATCLGATPARGGGFTGFICKLQLSDDVYMNLQAGYVYHLTARARGTWRRNPTTGKWKWSTTSISALS